MNAEKLIRIIGADFYTGVPDSQLRALCDCLMSNYGIDPKRHIIAANEGGCVALAAGYHLATGKVPVVYMQNSGEGNMINPAASLLNEKVYAIPMVFIIGWRGEPGTRDEPQHIFQGEITVKLLEDLGIEVFIIGKDTTDDEAAAAMEGFREKLALGRQVAFLVRRGGLTFDKRVEYRNENALLREDIIRRVTEICGEDIIVSTTGKASRELFEIREQGSQSHKYDLLTVGSMGHSSSIALGVALNCPEKKVWCIDGDGAFLMHMGSAAVIGAYKPKNLTHIVINNAAHETVGGMPTVAESMDIPGVARACGYLKAVSVDSLEGLDEALGAAKAGKELTLIEVKSRIGARADLGRPTVPAVKNKEELMSYLRESREKL